MLLNYLAIDHSTARDISLDEDQVVADIDRLNGDVDEQLRLVEDQELILLRVAIAVIQQLTFDVRV